MLRVVIEQRTPNKGHQHLSFCWLQLVVVQPNENFIPSQKWRCERVIVAGELVSIFCFDAIQEQSPSQASDSFCNLMCKARYYQTPKCAAGFFGAGYTWLQCARRGSSDPDCQGIPQNQGEGLQMFQQLLWQLLALSLRPCCQQCPQYTLDTREWDMPRVSGKSLSLDMWYTPFQKCGKKTSSLIKRRSLPGIIWYRQVLRLIALLLLYGKGHLPRVCLTSSWIDRSCHLHWSAPACHICCQDLERKNQLSSRWLQDEIWGYSISFIVQKWTLKKWWSNRNRCEEGITLTVCREIS